MKRCPNNFEFLHSRRYMDYATQYGNLGTHGLRTKEKSRTEIKILATAKFHKPIGV
jgi:hypothetical protein